MRYENGLGCSLACTAGHKYNFNSRLIPGHGVIKGDLFGREAQLITPRGGCLHLFRKGDQFLDHFDS